MALAIRNGFSASARKFTGFFGISQALILPRHGVITLPSKRNFYYAVIFVHMSSYDMINAPRPLSKENLESQGGVPAYELRDAEQVAGKLVHAIRNISFYPENHAIAKRSIEEAHETLASFIGRYGNFVVGIEKSHIHYRGRTLSRKDQFHKELAYKCFRDGIEYLVFSDGVGRDELRRFVDIVSRRSLMEDNTEGDIVTDMWEARLGQIKYTVNDTLWENEPLLDLDDLKVGRESPAESQAVSDVPADGEEAAADSIDADLQRLWQLTPEEIEVTRRMVREENNRSFDQDVFDVFLLILEEQKEREDFSNVLEVIIECFQRTLIRCEFDAADRFLGNMRHIYERYRVEHHWALPLLDDFLMMISSPRILKPLNDCLAEINENDARLLKRFESMLGRLAPESILSLIPMFVKLSSPRIRNHLNRAVMRLAERDPRPLYQLAKSDSTPLARQAIMNLSRLGETDHIPLIMKCAASEDVLLRQVSVKALTRIEPPPYEKILPFVLDADDIVRKTVSDFLIKRGDKEAVPALIDYISSTRFSSAHASSVIMLYEALGSIGSAEAFDFLKKQLFDRPWRIGTLPALHRQGALAALLQQQNPEASVQVGRAAKSPWPTIRRAMTNLSRVQGTDG